MSTSSRYRIHDNSMEYSKVATINILSPGSTHEDAGTVVLAIRDAKRTLAKPSGVELPGYRVVVDAPGGINVRSVLTRVDEPSTGLPLDQESPDTLLIQAERVANHIQMVNMYTARLVDRLTRESMTSPEFEQALPPEPFREDVRKAVARSRERTQVVQMRGTTIRTGGYAKIPVRLSQPRTVVLRGCTTKALHTNYVSIQLSSVPDELVPYFKGTGTTINIQFVPESKEDDLLRASKCSACDFDIEVEIRDRIHPKERSLWAVRLFDERRIIENASPFFARLQRY